MVNRALTYEQAQSVFKKEEVNADQAKKRSQYQQGKRAENQPATPQSKSKNPPAKKKCPGCDSEKHERKDCPHKDQICSFCKIKGHIESACRKKKQKDKDSTANYVKKECHLVDIVISGRQWDCHQALMNGVAIQTSLSKDVNSQRRLWMTFSSWLNL